jgi:hypothetical protein
VARGIRAVLQEVQPAQARSSVTVLPRIWNIPYPRNAVFTGREEILARIHTQLQAGRTMALSQAQAISGLGGIGKTQIAIEYAYRYRHEYQAVLWVRAESRETLTSSYSVIANLLDLPLFSEKRDL